MRLVQIIVLTTALTPLIHNVHACTKRVCVFYSKGMFNERERRLRPEDIPPFACTHIVYRSVGITDSDLYPYEGYDDGDETSVDLYTRVLALKQKNSRLRILLSLDGGSCHGYPFSVFYTEHTDREEFAENTVKYVRKFGFDGINVNCVYDTPSEIPSYVKNGLTTLMKELRAAIKREVRNVRTTSALLLTLDAVGYRAGDQTAYDMKKIKTEVDWIHLLPYGLNAVGSMITGHHCPLTASTRTGHDNSMFTTGNNCVFNTFNQWIRNRVPKNQLVVVIPSFANMFKLMSSEIGMFVPSSPGKPGPFTKSVRYMAYYEVCKLINASETVVYRPIDWNVPYLINKKQWIGFDDLRSMQDRVGLGKVLKAGGYIFLSLNTDDFEGTFCGQGKFPLLNMVIDSCNRN